MDWLPSRQTILRTGTALAAFTALSVGVIGIVDMFYSDDPSSNNHCLAIQQIEPATSLPSAALGTIAAVASAAFVNKFQLEEFRDCQPALMRARKSIWLCERNVSDVKNQTQAIQLPKDRGLASNLELAKGILRDTLEMVRFSPNNLARSRKIIEKRAEKQGIELSDLSQVANSECLELSRFGALYEAGKQGGGLFNLLRIQAEFAKSTAIGNCGEMAAVALFKGMEQGIWDS